eukprot:2675207-Prorocentrum_lima.AAC.1
MENPPVLQPPASEASFTQLSQVCAARYDMAHRTLQDARALLELQDHLTTSIDTETDADRDAQCHALQRELEAAKSLVASRDMLAA